MDRTMICTPTHWIEPSFDPAETTFVGALGAPHPDVCADRDLYAEAAIAVDRDLQACGYQLTVHRDPSDFVAIVGGVGKFIPNAFDMKLKPARPGEVLGLVLRDRHGDVAATNGIRLYRLQRSLADHLSTLSLFYANPIDQMLGGEHLVLDGDARSYASRINGSAVWTGCFWVRPDHRGAASNVSNFMTFAVRLLAAMHYGRTITFSLVESWLRKQTAAQKIGAPSIYERVVWHRPQVPMEERGRRSDMMLMVTEPDIPKLRAERYLAGIDRLAVPALAEEMARA